MRLGNTVSPKFGETIRLQGADRASVTQAQQALQDNPCSIKTERYFHANQGGVYLNNSFQSTTIKGTPEEVQATYNQYVHLKEQMKGAVTKALANLGKTTTAPYSFDANTSTLYTEADATPQALTALHIKFALAEMVPILKTPFSPGIIYIHNVLSNFKDYFSNEEPLVNYARTSDVFKRPLSHTLNDEVTPPQQASSFRSRLLQFVDWAAPH
jgi:hypothetical protein